MGSNRSRSTPLPPADRYPASVKLVIRNFETATDEDLLALLRGHEALVFAAGMDDRNNLKKPAYPKFYHANVDAPVRILGLAKQAGVKHAVVFGSYFAHFHRLWPEMKLAQRHPYIRSRVEQERAVTSLSGIAVDVLELPYVFGDPLGRKPLWYPLVKYIRAAPLAFYMRGGTACITAKMVGKAAFGVIEHGHGSTCYPIGQENLIWDQMLTRLARADGRTVRVVSLPSWVIKISMLGIWLIHKLQMREGGLNLRYFSALQTAETFIDPEPSRNALGYELDNLDVSFRETVEACNG